METTKDVIFPFLQHHLQHNGSLHQQTSAKMQLEERPSAQTEKLKLSLPDLKICCGSAGGSGSQDIYSKNDKDDNVNNNKDSKDKKACACHLIATANCCDCAMQCQTQNGWEVWPWSSGVSVPVWKMWLNAFWSSCPEPTSKDVPSEFIDSDVPNVLLWFLSLHRRTASRVDRGFFADLKSQAAWSQDRTKKMPHVPLWRRFRRPPFLQLRARIEHRIRGTFEANLVGWRHISSWWHLWTLKQRTPHVPNGFRRWMVLRSLPGMESRSLPSGIAGCYPLRNNVGMLYSAAQAWELH